MGQYANVSSRRMRQFLKWLGNHKMVDVLVAGKHPIKVTSHASGESYPLPASHNVMSKHIIKDFMEWLVRNNICTEEEFDQHL